MKKIYLLLISSLMVSLANAQIMIIEPGGSTDLNGSTIEVTDVPSASDMEAVLYIVNSSSSSLTLTCTRTEVDGQAGTDNATCWQICPPSMATGSKQIYTVNLSGTNLEESAAAGDTITSFVGHYYPNGIDGCSLFRYDWNDATTGTSYGHVYVRFIHLSSGTCTASEEEIAVDFDLYPNPANENLNVQLTEAYSKDFNVRVVDVLGKVVMNTRLAAGSVYTTIPTLSLTEGVYFVTFNSDNDTLLTKKIVVRH